MAKIIGLTGPMGAGKSTVAALFRRRRAAVIEVDQLAHTLYVPQSQIWHQLVQHFGSSVLAKGGKVNRKKLAALVFSDPEALADLNKIVHPALYDCVGREVARLKSQGKDLIIISAALLFEIGLDKLVDVVWTVKAAEKTRIKRLFKKGFKLSEIRKRFKAQGRVNAFYAKATLVLPNDASFLTLQKKFNTAFLELTH